MKNMTKTLSINEAISLIRSLRGLTQEELAVRCSNISRSYIAQIESNPCKNPTLKTLEEIACALGIDSFTLMLFAVDLDSISPDQRILVEKMKEKVIQDIKQERMASMKKQIRNNLKPRKKKNDVIDMNAINIFDVIK